MTASDPRVIVAQIGARMHYAVPRIYHRADMLERFYTDICAVQGWPRCLKLIPPSLRPSGIQNLLDRVPRGIPRDRIHSFPTRSLAHILRRRASSSRSGGRASQLSFGRAFGRQVVREGVEDADAVYAFKSAALEILRSAQKADVKTILEMPSAPEGTSSQLLSEEHQRWPDWHETSPVNGFVKEKSTREKREWTHADVILCPSSFVRDSLVSQGGPGEKCEIVPYGVDWNVNVDFNHRNQGPLRVLTVGSVSLVKGSPYVLEAARSAGDEFRFRMVGALRVAEAPRRQLERHVDLRGAVPRSRVREHYRWADVLLLPSLCEGSATVTYEALASGLPVICTPHTGSIVRDGEEGFVVPIRDPKAILEALGRLHGNRNRLEAMSRAALHRYEDRGSLEAYADRLLEVTRRSLVLD